jgi:hypothetical protein
VLASHFLPYIDVAAPTVFTEDSLILKPHTGKTWVATDSAICARGLQAWVEAGGKPVDSLGVVVVGTSGFVVLVQGDYAGEWHLTHWFDRDWHSLGFALGM